LDDPNARRVVKTTQNLEVNEESLDRGRRRFRFVAATNGMIRG
jgi:hypothetical protein